MQNGERTSATLTFDVGLWRVESIENSGGWNTACRTWRHHSLFDENDLDGSMIFARIISMTVIWCGILLVIMMMGTCCCIFPRNLLHWSSILCFILGALCLLTLVALSSDFCKGAEECQIQWAGILAIAGCPMWTVAGLGIIFLLKSKPDPNQEKPRSIQIPIQITPSSPLPSELEDPEVLEGEESPDADTKADTTMDHADNISEFSQE